MSPPQEPWDAEGVSCKAATVEQVGQGEEKIHLFEGGH